MTIGPESKVLIEHIRYPGENRPSKLRLLYGQLRSMVPKESNSKVKQQIRTGKVSLAVRGTDFQVRYDDWIKKTWLYVKNGNVTSRWKWEDGETLSVKGGKIAQYREGESVLQAFEHYKNLWVRNKKRKITRKKDDKSWIQRAIENGERAGRVSRWHGEFLVEKARIELNREKR